MFRFCFWSEIKHYTFLLLFLGAGGGDGSVTWSTGLQVLSILVSLNEYQGKAILYFYKKKIMAKQLQALTFRDISMYGTQLQLHFVSHPVASCSIKLTIASGSKSSNDFPGFDSDSLERKAFIALLHTTIQ